MSGSLRGRVEALLGPGGGVSARWPRYEPRAGQLALALDVAERIERGGVLLAEAPTGVGKSLAYLLPGVLHALESGRRVVVATCTRSLQDQLFERDLPALLAALGDRLECVRLKGKQNYLCEPTLALTEGQGPEERETLEELRRWASAETEGDLDRFPARDAEAFRRLRPRVATDPHACTVSSCRRGRECFWLRARRRAATSRLLVVNHALLALAGEVEGLLPEFDVLIVDEAHRLEGVLLAQLERSVSRNRFDELLRLVGSGRRAARRATTGDGTVAGGLLARVRHRAAPLLESRGEASRELLDELARLTGRCRDDAGRLFEQLERPGDRDQLYGVRARYRSAEELLGRDLEPLEQVLGDCGAFARGLVRLGDALAGQGEGGEPLAAESIQLASRFGLLGQDLEQLADARDRDWVYWRASGGRGVELKGAPVSAAPHARRLVLERARTAVLTSATLSTGGDFAFVAGRLGLGEEHGLAYEAGDYPSPFALERQVASFVYDGSADEAEAVATVVAELVRATGRNLLALFTAHERLRRARERMLELLPRGAVLLAQDRDGPASLLAERFRLERGAVLLGVQSLWEGVDFPGPALEILVVAKLPFSVPDDPMVEARGERLREQGLDPFRHDAVPEAVLRFRQGVGRLIRRADDRGVLVVCDARLERASYRAPFLSAVPGSWRLERDAKSLAEAAARFLGGPVAVEEQA